MICISTIKKYCKEDISKIENYDKAIADKSQVWCCHHRDEIRTLPSGMIALRTTEELKECGRYYDCPANELIFLTKSEHIKLHNEVREYKPHKGQIWSDFGRKFKEHYGITQRDNTRLYYREHKYYSSHNHKCRWEE